MWLDKIQLFSWEGAYKNAGKAACIFGADCILGRVDGVVVAGVRYLLRWLLPFILALGLAALVEPVIAWCRRRMGLKRGSRRQW